MVSAEAERIFPNAKPLLETPALNIFPSPFEILNLSLSTYTSALRPHAA